MAKTIRQIAEELGVSKTAVSKQIDNLGLRSSLRKIGNQFSIDNQQETAIKLAFSQKSQTEIDNQIANQFSNDNQEVSDLVCVLKATIDTLQQQLSVKDKQIEELNERLAEVSAALVVAQNTAQAAQALHAGTIQQQLADGEPGMQEQNKGKKSWLSRFFKN